MMTLPPAGMRFLVNAFDVRRAHTAPGRSTIRSILRPWRATGVAGYAVPGAIPKLSRS